MIPLYLINSSGEKIRVGSGGWAAEYSGIRLLGWVETTNDSAVGRTKGRQIDTITSSTGNRERSRAPYHRSARTVRMIVIYVS
jgi:hypothetical protein